MGKIFAEERRNLILTQLQKEKRLTVKELAQSLKVSEATLRSDLNIMEEEGLLTRTHGGAVLNESIPPKNNFSDRAMKNIESKKSITNIAINLISYKSSILLDASTTALELAHKLKSTDMRLTVVTNGLSTAIELKENPNINVILMGGIARMGSMALEGPLGTDILDKINIDIMFTSASGFTIEEGLTDFNVYEVELKKQMVKKADRVVALLDHSKIGSSSISSFATTEQIDTIITDETISDEMLNELDSFDVEVIIKE
ncbi:DNA-binding transcriptional regulator of sugar metabolism, DeoR/GlpR family [Salinibacillus kushneri]|uniref:DNA-binding transcriptional regulator of sugar metabolism, DeoR/GlpR family n=1 Tax=Salinibacillus kushneri TaxID=237682 RepID=A0A1H9ZAQ7_9BACI|nr:DeoR/GlpR family DNA-binding transcription regulator [Salinibacillus kushneri]SES78548.1 DNA-binding transcriptional regulator of sugar metabolism, DeoR/GlpR family [Salinibacillus kushneri]